MNPAKPQPAATRSPSSGSRIPVLLSAAIIVLAALVAWHNSLSAPFIFDDEAVIKENPTIRHLWPLWTVLSPPAGGGGSGVTGRPIVNLSLAINYALGGLDVRGYHLLNLVIHLLAGLTLFGIVRRTLALGTPARPIADAGRGRRTPPPPEPTLPAFLVALLWTLHPLVTETVTCVVQRTESLVALFYLLTLYTFIRAVEETTRPLTTDNKAAGRIGPVVRGPWSPRPLVWYSLSVLACLLGMATKEVMVTAPLIVLLYDRAFVAGTFREAWRRRRRWYLGLAATWLLLGYLVLSSGGQRAGSVGFGLGLSWWTYALTQCRAITLYLKLAVWPHPLVVDYGYTVAHSLAAVWWRGIVVLGLLGATIWALVRRPRGGFLGAWFFLILAPSSSVLPLVTQTIAEHRMYLPLAAVVAAGVLAWRRWTGRAGLVALLVLAAGFGWLTRLRNADYRTVLSIWEDAVAKVPTNPRAHGNLGNALLAAGRYADAIAQYRDALRLKPDYNQIYNNLGDALLQLHRPREAIAAFEGALRLFPYDPDVHNNLGNAFLQLGRTDDAIREYQETLRIWPDSPTTEVNLARVLLQTGRTDEAIRHFEAALRLEPRRAETHDELAGAFQRAGNETAAEREYREALRLAPGLVEARFGLGNLLARSGRYDAAIAEYRRVLQFDPGHLKARNNLGNVLLMTGRYDAAIAAYEEILRQQPDNASARANLAQARALQREAAPPP